MPEREDTRPIKVEVRNLTKRFGDLLVLDDMSFNIRKGEFVCVVGPTGCGKTTFLNCLTRIHMPSEGDLYIDGVPADPRKHNISFVFQEPSALPWLTVEDNLAYGLKIKRIPKAEIDRRVDQILDLMGLQEFRKAYPGRPYGISVIFSTFLLLSFSILARIFTFPPLSPSLYLLTSIIPPVGKSG